MFRTTAAAGLLLAATSGLAQAAQIGQSLGVSATILNGCTVSAITVAFGAYTGQATSPAIDTLGQITVTCANGNPWNVRLDNGANGGAGGQRRMQRTIGAGLLAYGLFKDAARTQRWGSNNAERLSGIGTGAAQQLPVYARLPGAQVVPSGPYQDTITVTVQY